MYKQEKQVKTVAKKHKITYEVETEGKLCGKKCRCGHYQDCYAIFPNDKSIQIERGRERVRIKAVGHKRTSICLRTFK